MRRSVFASFEFACGTWLVSVFPDMGAFFVRYRWPPANSCVTSRLVLLTVLRMTDNRKAGIAVIAGSIGGIVTMAIHPTGAGTLTADQLTRLESMSGIAHSLGMISMLFLFLGACGLTQRIAGEDRLAFSGLVVDAFAVVAVLIAAAVSGFIVPGIMRQMVHDAPAAAPTWRIAIASVFQINQAFSRIYSVAASAAILLWSISSLRHGGLSRFVG